MILDIQTHIEQYNLTPTGVIHVGAHYGQEHQLYKTLGLQRIVYFEPVLENYNALWTNVANEPNVTLWKCALGNENKHVHMNIESVNQGQSSSILKPKLHLEQYPHIVFDKTEEVMMYRLDDVDVDLKGCNFMNIDVQGFELEVLKGSSQTLQSIDFIITEVNNDEVYENCAKIDEIDNYLSNFNFKRVETCWAGGIWGDALYIKQ